EIAEVTALLSREEARSRLITLTGTGGTGKTRLALQAAADLLTEFPDGVFLVEFAALSDGALVVQTVASALGLREEPGRSLTQTLTDHLKSKRMLLLLDNCEHLIQDCALLAAELLRICPDLRLLATSREPLNLSSERIYRVPSLSLPAAIEGLGL